ncbi:hypothetical protein ScalyP_jg10675 [Parmales sp. scaly parma]|nr:hypothetical protein ScalyP_jg10675 [Parmales sp. scaly parma]
MPCIGSDKVLDRLVFIHMFKTAGSTIRTLFREYSKKCDRGWVCVTDCSDLDPSSFIGKESIDAVWQPREDSKTWDNPPKCRIKDQVTRTDSRDVEFERPPDNERIRNNADILGGHLSLGVNPWAQQDHINVRYLTFVRDTPIKFVSGLIYTTFQMDPATTTTVQQMSVKIKKRILKARDKFECYGDGMTSFAKYLLTPEQKKELVDKFGLADKVPASFSSELVKRNLGELNVVVGAVERMGESMRLLQTLIDFDGEQSEIFEIYGSGGRQKNVSKNKR